MDLFKELGTVLQPEMLVTIYLTTGIEHDYFKTGTSAKEIQKILINRFGSDVLSWNKN